MGFELSAESERQKEPVESGGSRWLFLVSFAVFVSLGFLMIYSRFSEPIEQMGGDHPGVGNQLAVLKCEPFIDADQIVTQQDLQGHVTLINYWGPWCSYCLLEMPDIAEIEQKYRQHHQFQFLSVACGIAGYPSVDAMRRETASYRNRAKLEFPIYFDPSFASRSSLEAALGKEPQSLVFPTTVLIDQRGKIAGVWEGYSASLPDELTSTLR